ncbi:hypothetical protein EZV62_011835 [Acer yangbiense]|uniref:Uncharacterized protein n=1 Tax=Acer yangbiense TaxID=1000413 RepID=A0A5C7I6E1_9ROSI|nr:hypothetical protein EZV62_011835 [Acer yangbiense]
MERRGHAENIKGLMRRNMVKTEAGCNVNVLLKLILLFSFWFDLSSGKKCYMISPRELNISKADCIYHWCWISIPDANADAKRWFGMPDCRNESRDGKEGYPGEVSGTAAYNTLTSSTTMIRDREASREQAHSNHGKLEP